MNKTNRSRKQYYVGSVITSLEEFANQKFILYNGKVYHFGWFGSWPFNWVNWNIKRGNFRRAISQQEVANLVDQILEDYPNWMPF